MMAKSADHLHGRANARARILFVNHTAQLGGGELALLHLVKQLDRSRFEPIVALLSHGPMEARLAEVGVECHVLDAGDVVSVRKDALGGRALLKVRHALAALRTAIRLARFIRRNAIDLVHANSLKADIIAGAAGRLARTPVLWHVRDRIADDYLPSRVASAFRKLAHFVPRFVVTNSHATRATLTTQTGDRLAKRFEVVHDGIPDRPLPTPTDRSNEEPIIGLVGRITPWKGQDVFIRAAASVLKRVPNARFQIIGSAMFGEAAYEQEVKTLAEKLGVADHVWFAGFRTDVPALIDRLDVLVHASTVAEPFGQVVIEGMIAAKPVVATAGGGVLEIVEDGATGRLVPMGDAEAMADAIADVLADPHRAAAMGAAGRRRVQKHFSIQLTAARIEAVYTRILWPEAKPHNADSDRALPTPVGA